MGRGSSGKGAGVQLTAQARAGIEAAQARDMPPRYEEHPRRKKDKFVVIEQGIFGGMEQRSSFQTKEDAIRYIETAIADRESGWNWTANDIRGMNVNNYVEMTGYTKQQFVERPEIFNEIQRYERELRARPWEQLLESITKRKKGK